MTNTPARLGDILERPDAFQGWLYLPSTATWTLDTQGMCVDEEYRRLGEPATFPSPDESQFWCETLDVALIEDTIENARQQLGRTPAQEERLVAFIYYVKNDSFKLFET